MKKLNLNLGGLKTMLTKDQMKKITGGDYGTVDSCTVSCKSGYWACCTTYKTGTNQCTCVKDGSEAGRPCSSGGTGSSSCSAGD